MSRSSDFKLFDKVGIYMDFYDSQPGIIIDRAPINNWTSNEYKYLIRFVNDNSVEKWFEAECLWVIDRG